MKTFSRVTLLVVALLATRHGPLRAQTVWDTFAYDFVVDLTTVPADDSAIALRPVDQALLAVGLAAGGLVCLNGD